jgi:hypothetical protein
MQTERKIRARIIAMLTNVYTSTPDLGPGAEPQPLWEDPDNPEWTSEEITKAYTEVASMFLYYARKVEDRGGPSFLEYLRRQATVNELADDPDED